MIFLKQYIIQATAACIIILVSVTNVQSQPDTLWTNSVYNAGYNLQVIRTTDNGFAVGTHGLGGVDCPW
jgi:hypothetical protein